MKPRKPGDYAVGYGKTPEATRFKKGRSGNPTGRPRGRRTLAAILQHALAARVVVTEHGRRTRKSKLQIMLTQLVNKGAGGDLKATALVLDLLPLLDPASAGALGLPDLAADHAMAERVIARMAAALLPDVPTDAPSPTPPETSRASH